ncbi:TRAP transporter substrate-binding protein DctP [Microbacterium sp. zg.B48]|uniref:TRAP transporter substrate-binding protein DctP n=1 Tax=Microbacterium sp. zg.B48 TaxID=2969408 RepID=UPI00214B242F|nr:TRAP transporter substrate-binding protein DctP [Microbacterium sp. zg.B48]MCR2764352.1 TRAP transporter substrate-binding protein DctP [Microbacterium sp. zg.B48]
MATSSPYDQRPRLRRVLATSVAAATLLALTACAGAGSEAEPSGEGGGLGDMTPVKLSFTTNVPAAGALGRAQTYFGEEVEKRSDGKITVENYFSGELLPGNEVLGGVGSGIASIGFVTPFYNPTETPITYWMEGLGNELPHEIPASMTVGTAATQDLFESNEALNAEFEAQNVKVLSVANTGPYRLACTKPIETPADAAGVTVRSNSEIWNGELASIGMVPASIPLTEVYEAMQRGVIDCWASTEASFIDEGVMEFVTDFTPVNMSAPVSTAIFIMNLDEWNALPEEAQEIVQATMADALWQWNANQIAARAEIAGLENVEWHDPSDLNDVIFEHQDQRVENLAANAPSTLDDPEAFIAEYRALLEEYSAVLDGVGATAHDLDAESIRDAYLALPDFDLEAYLDAVAEHRAR